jgi:hypothetical protein
MSAATRAGTGACPPPTRTTGVQPAAPGGRDSESRTPGGRRTSVGAQVKMSRGRNAETTKLGTSTTSLTLRSTATLQIA